MKRIAIALLISFVVAVPVAVFACTPGVDCPTNYADIKAYGDMTANYGTGAVAIISTTTTNNYGNTQEWTAMNNVVGNPTPYTSCTSPGCGMQITQGSLTNTTFNTNIQTTMTGINLMGSNEMNTLGGLAVCGTPGWNEGLAVPVSGSLFQTQNVSQYVSGPISVGNSVLNTSSAYNATQTLQLTKN